MEVILLERIGNLGDLGEKVEVRAGYGRNFLIPQGKAIPATKENLASFEARRAELEKRAAESLAAAQARADKLAELGSVTIAHQAGEGGKLFGSVSTTDIADAVSSAGVEITRKEVRLPEGPLRMTGEHQVDIQLHSLLTQQIKVIIEAE